MKTVKIILTSLLVIIWIVASFGYYSNNELTGFYISQLFFIPLIGGLFLLNQERNLGIITLIFWAMVIYTSSYGPFREIVKFIPFLLLVIYLARFFAKTHSRELKTLSIVVSSLNLMTVVRLAKIFPEYDWTIINEIHLLAIPILLVAHVYRHELKLEPNLSSLTIFMTSIIAIEILIKALHVHIIDFSSTILTATTTSMLIVLCVTTWILYRNHALEEVRKISLSYFVWTLFIQLGEWVLNSINDIN